MDNKCVHEVDNVVVDTMKTLKWNDSESEFLIDGEQFKCDVFFQFRKKLNSLEKCARFGVTGK